MNCFSLADTLVLAGTAGAGGMAPSASTRIAVGLKRDQGHSNCFTGGYYHVVPHDGNDDDVFSFIRDDDDNDIVTSQNKSQA